MRVLRYILATPLMVMLLGLLGCEHHHLYYSSSETANVKINVDWTNTGLSPNGVTAIAYYNNGDLYRSFPAYSNPNEVNISLPVGTFDVVLFNNTPSEYLYIEFLNSDNISTVLANAKLKEAVRSVSDDDSDKDVVANPEVLASIKVEDIVVTQSTVDYYWNKPDSYESSTLLEYSAEPVRRVINVRVYVHTIGLKYASGSPRCFFKHFSGGFLLGEERSDERQVMQEFVLNNREFDAGSDVDGTITQEFTSFGEVTDPDATYVVDIDFTLLDGSSFPVIVDVTDQIELYMDGYTPRIDIFLEIELPETEGDSSGNSSFDTSVEDWNDIVVSLPM